jgi:flagellar hook-basal body complex protein FliE
MHPINATGPVASTRSTSGAEFGNVLTRGVDALQKTQADADGLATQAATGSLDDNTQ